MRAGMLVFVISVIATTQLLDQPLSGSVSTALLVLSLLGYALLPRGWRWPLSALLAVAWSTHGAEVVLERQLAAGPKPHEAYLQLLVTDVPEQHDRYTVFNARALRLVEGQLNSPLPERMRLRWYHPTGMQASKHGSTQNSPPTETQSGVAPRTDDGSPTTAFSSTAQPFQQEGSGEARRDQLRAGDIWQLRLRLRPPVGFLNPAGFDYQRWLFVRQIGATGYVINSPNNRLIGSRATLHGWRQAITQAMTRQLGASQRLGLVQGLGVAVRSGISDAQWRVLSNTGTAHLLAISGMHIGMVAASIGWAVAGIWRFAPPLARRLPALTAGTLAGVMAAGGYAALAGFTLPTQRALVMVAVFALALLTRRPLQPWSGMLAAACAVLIIDPWAALGAGFWLSFGAVAIILAASQGRRLGKGVWPWLRLQGVVGIAMLPAIAMCFGHLPWLSPLANWIAVPWVSFAVLPLVLGGIALLPVSESLAGLAWRGADISLAGVMAVLEALEQFFGSVALSPAPLFAFILAIIGVLYLLAPRGLPGRWLALPLLLTLVLLPAGSKDTGERIVLFDTGEGMAAILAAHGEAIIYGAGPGGSSGALKVALEPYLEKHGLRPIVWIVPRDEKPWSGAVARARRDWGKEGVQIEWVDNPYDCANWRAELGSLALATRVGDGGCQLLIRGTKMEQDDLLIVQPAVFRGSQEGAAFGKESDDAACPRLLVGMRGCRPPGSELNPCHLVLAKPGSDCLELDTLATTRDDGAITVYPSTNGWRYGTQVEKRGRIFHRQKRED